MRLVEHPVYRSTALEVAAMSDPALFVRVIAEYFGVDDHTAAKALSLVLRALTPGCLAEALDRNAL